MVQNVAESNFPLGKHGCCRMVIDHIPIKTVVLECIKHLIWQIKLSGYTSRGSNYHFHLLFKGGLCLKDRFAPLGANLFFKNRNAF